MLRERLELSKYLIFSQACLPIPPSKHMVRREGLAPPEVARPPDLQSGPLLFTGYRRI